MRRYCDEDELAVDEPPFMGGLDRGVVSGVAICLGLVVVGIAFGGSAGNFVSPVGLVIALGGTIGSTLVHFSLTDIKYAWAALKDVMVERKYDPLARIQYMVGLAQDVRKRGVLVLDEEAEKITDPFLKLAFQLTVDAQGAEDIRRILGTEIKMANDRAWRSVQIFETMGTYAPAMGLIGTLLGLIHMLGALDDPAKVGPAMAMALVTTLYGAVMANMFFLPVAGKLKNRNEEGAVLKAITIEGVISIGKQENPIVVEQRLQSFKPLASAA